MPDRRSSSSLRTTFALLFSLQLACAPVLLAQQRMPSPPLLKSPAAQRETLSEGIAAAINGLLNEPPYAPAKTQNIAVSAQGRLSEDKPPADDAPLKELIEYWQQQARDQHSPKPSDKVRQRLLEAIEERPWLLNGLLDWLPENEETKERLYQLYTTAPDEDEQWKLNLHNWLQYNSRYFRDELLALARDANLEQGEGVAALQTLARLDWEAAEPLLEARQQPFAITLLYEHATQNGELAEAEKYRPQLQALVTDRSAGELRAPALQSLLKTEWNGQAEWYATLFADTTLTGWRPSALDNEAANDTTRRVSGRQKGSWDAPGEGAENLLAWPLQAQPERYVPQVIKLLDHSDRFVHNGAADALAEFVMEAKPDDKLAGGVMRALLPWIENPAWADSPKRVPYIARFVDFKVPESFASLLWLLVNEEEDMLRTVAAIALGKLRNPAAAPALKSALALAKEEQQREEIITALVRCGGLSDEEALAALEAYARRMATPKGLDEINAARDGQGEKLLPLPLSIGRALAESDAIEIGETLAARVFERVRQLRSTRPDIAKTLLNVVQGVPFPVAYQFLAWRIAEGWVDTESLKLALEDRAALHKHATDELAKLADGYAAGVAAVILQDANATQAVLKGKDADSQLALLACARYLREPLPLDLVANLFADQKLGKAAESYLMVENSPAARRLVWAHHPGEALILGDSILLSELGDEQHFNNYPGRREEALRREVLRQDGAETVYAMLYGRPNYNQQNVEIRVRKSQAELRLYRDPNRWRARALTDSELIELQTFTAQPEIEELKSEAAESVEERYEYLRLTKDGGHRLILGGLHRAPRNPTWHERLGDLFYRLSQTGEYRLHYAIEEQLPGAEVLWSDEQQDILMACREADEWRVLVQTRTASRDKAPVPYLRLRALSFNLAGNLLANNPPEWRVFANGQIGALTEEPKSCRLSEFLQATKRLGRGAMLNFLLGRSTGEKLWADLQGKEPGIYQQDASGNEQKLLSGRYFAPLATPDGKWIIALKIETEKAPQAPTLVRYNRQTKEELPVKLDKEGFWQPVSYLAAHDKVLLGQSAFGFGAAGQQPHWLLDPATGAVQQVQGVFQPLYDSPLRPLQPTGNPNEVWAAIYDERKKATVVGRYDTKEFRFAPQLELPGLPVSSADIWVDQATNKLWLVYQGDLLRLPLAASAK